MTRLSAIIIGAGQAGLAMSHCLSQGGVEHVVLERGRVAERWRSERWDSLRLLTPNWMSRLPGWSYQGPDPDGFMAVPALVDYLAGYARSLSAPIETETDVRAVTWERGHYRVETTRGVWSSRVVVVATGQCDMPAVPAFAADLPASIRQVVPSRYRNADTLPQGGVLVVGASATGVQLAEEIHLSGRPVTLSVGRHTRLPRVYRGRDIMWWLDRAGVLNDPIGKVRDPGHVRSQPSLQLVGRPDRRTVNLAVLRELGIRVVGRAEGIDGTTVRLRPDLPETTMAAWRKLDRALDRIDAYAGDAAGPDDLARRTIDLGPGPDALDLDRAGIRTVIWATGYRRDYRWLKVPVLDGDGELRHDGGVVPWPGLYVLGLTFLRRRKSNFIDGVGADAEDLTAHVQDYLRAAGGVAA